MDKQVDKMLSMIGTKPPLKANIDSDGDKVINIVDCEPYNKKKQGVMHWIRAKAQGRDYEEVRDEDIERRRQASKAALEERYKQREETAIYKEKQRGERERNYIKQGGFFGMVSKATRQPAPRRVRVYNKTVGKGKKRKVKRTYSRGYSTPPKPQKMLNINDFKLDMPRLFK